MLVSIQLPRFETIDPTSRLLVAIIVLQNHHKYNLFQAGRPYTIDVDAITKEVDLSLMSLMMKVSINYQGM
jgi:hypothetical protein